MANQSKLTRSGSRKASAKTDELVTFAKEVKAALGHGVPIEESDEAVRVVAEKFGRYLVRG